MPTADLSDPCQYSLRALLDKAHTLNAEEGFEEVEDDQDFEDNRASTGLTRASLVAEPVTEV